MDFDLDADQLALRSAAAELLDHHAAPSRVRAVVDHDVEQGDDANGDDRVDPVLWQAMVDQGWFGIAVDEASGGAGLGWVEAALLLEQVGAHVAPAPVLGTLVAIDALTRSDAAGSPPLDGTLAALVAGESWAAVASTGRRELVPGAPGATVVVGPGPDGDLRAWLGGPWVPEPVLDRTRSVAWFDPEAAGDGIVLGGPDAVPRHLQVGAVALSAELLGIAQRMLDVSVAYARERVQFGKPIGSFQAVKHRCADMLVDVEAMRSAVWWAAWCVATEHGDATVAASAAKSWCSDAGLRVCQSALQVHGGIGFTWECDVHLYLKRAQLDAVCFGDAPHHLARLAELLRAKVDAGESVL